MAACFLIAQGSLTKREVPDAIIQPPQTYHKSQPGIQLQSGEISYLAPNSKSSYVNTISDLVVKEGIIEKIKATVPAVIKTATKVLSKVAVATLTVVAIGVSLAAIFFISGFLLCEFTSYCYLPSIVLTGYNNENLEEVVRAYMAPDKLTALGNFVTNSIEKFSKTYKYDIKS